MHKRFITESSRLAESWMRHDQRFLRDYLVQDVEDPRINVQSILSRHFLIEQLFGEEFTPLAEQELRFALVVNWLLRLLETSACAADFHALLYALTEGHKHAGKFKIPRYVSETFAALAMPNYIWDLLYCPPAETADAPIPDYLLKTFEPIWREVLENEHPSRISVLEPACGSANDYRFLQTFGLARFLNYTGIDICEKNIQNAEQMFPGVTFRTANVLDIDAPDNSFDYCIVHDLFEHLSAEAMELAITQLCRVTRKALSVAFFNMQETDHHIVHPVDNYHWNTLSLSKTKALFAQHASVVNTAHIHSFLSSRFACADTHNNRAYTFIVEI